MYSACYPTPLDNYLDLSILCLFINTPWSLFRTRAPCTWDTCLVLEDVICTSILSFLYLQVDHRKNQTTAALISIMQITTALIPRLCRWWQQWSSRRINGWWHCSIQVVLSGSVDSFRAHLKDQSQFKKLCDATLLRD